MNKSLDYVEAQVPNTVNTKCPNRRVCVNTYSIGSNISPKKNGPTILYPPTNENQEIIKLKFEKYCKWMMELVSHSILWLFMHVNELYVFMYMH